MKKMIMPIAMLIAMGANGQGFVNGSFESTTSVGCDYNNGIAEFNGVMDNVVMFAGTETDIHSEGCLVSGFPDGGKVVGLAALDAINLELTDPLISGEEYELTFWKYANSLAGSFGDLEIGSTEDSGIMGALIETVPDGAPNTWLEYSFIFIAPNNGTHISVRNIVTGNWNQVDDFSIILTCDALTTSVSDTDVCIGETVTLEAASTAPGAIVTWDMGVVDGVAFAPPIGTTTYTATSDNADDCVFSVDVTVHDPVVTASIDDDDICLGDEITFSGGGATTYIWDMGVTDGTAFEPVSAGTETYMVTGTDAFGCENTATIDATANALPIVTASVDDDEVCLGGEFTFTGGGATSYAWDMGVTDGVAFEPATASIETYTVVGTDVNGCENTASVDATVYALPVVTASADETEICLGESVTFTGGGATSYAWDMGVIDGESFEPLLDGIATYSVTGTDGNGCQNTASVDVTAFVLPTVTASVDDDEICLGNEFTFTGGGATSYTWDMGVTDAIAFEPITASTETYTVTGTDDNGCENTAAIDATVNALPVVTASVDSDEICLGGEFTFTGGGATSYAWDMGVTDGVAFEPVTVSTETYTVTGTDVNGCENTASVDATVHALPVVTASVDEADICFGESVIFTGGGAASYAWDMGVTDGAVFTPATAGTETYTVTGTDVNGCQNSASVDVNVNEEIIITYTTVDEIIADGEIDLTITGGLPAYTFDWDTDEADDFDDSEDLTDLTAGFYTVVVRDAAGCEKTEIIEIILLCNPLTVDVSDFTICETELLTLDATSESGATITWDGGAIDGVAFFTEVIGVITFTATSADPLDCPISVDIEVLASPTVIPSVGGENYCDGDEIVLSASGDADAYSWDPIDLTPGIGVTTYTVTGTYDLTGCSTSESIDVTVHGLPTVSASADIEEVCIGNSIVLSGSGALTYNWDPAAITDGEEFMPEAVGTFIYTVFGTDDNGCTNSDDISITVADEMEITFVSTDEMIFEDGEINITVTGGVAPYSFDWDTDEADDFDDDEDLTGLADGLYIVNVQGSTGCSAQATVILGTQVSIDVFETNSIRVYPNPTVDQITIAVDGTFTYALFDIAGGLILTGNALDQEELSLEKLPAGVYLVKIQNDQKVEVVQVVKN